MGRFRIILPEFAPEYRQRLFDVRKTFRLSLISPAFPLVSPLNNFGDDVISLCGYS
jgi:hypothetical protein